MEIDREIEAIKNEINILKKRNTIKEIDSK
jgi:hypothetical protein